MLGKNDLLCLKFLRRGVFCDEIIVTQTNAAVRSLFYLKAIKKSRIASNSVDYNMVMTELMIRSNIRHPFILNQIMVLQDFDYLFHLSEYAPAQLMDSRILPSLFSPIQLRFYAIEIFMGLKYLHSKHHIYTYLSPQNILLDKNGHVKLNYSFCNSLWDKGFKYHEEFLYVPPEYFQEGKFSMFSDYWSLGNILYKLLNGYNFFEIDSLTEEEKKIDNPNDFFRVFKNKTRRAEVTFRNTDDPDLVDFITFLLTTDLKAKFKDIDELERTIENHPIFSTFDKEKLLNRTEVAPFNFKLPVFELKKSPLLGSVFTNDFIDGTRDGYGFTFKRYTSTAFLKKKAKTIDFLFQRPSMPKRRLTKQQKFDLSKTQNHR